jgi:hypothetical protein
VTAKPSSSNGSKAIQPIRAGNAVLYIQIAGRQLHEMAYVFESDGFRSPDMTILSEHITRPKVLGMAYQKQPQSIIWLVRSDGVLLGFTYVRDQNVLAWHRHIIGGIGDVSDGPVIVESVEVIPEPNGTFDEVYIIAKRYINGRTERYIEILSKVWESGDDQEDAFHVDCGATITSSPASATITGLWYVEGETLAVWADGTVHPDVTITNGKATLDTDYSIKTVGYNYFSDGETMPFNGGAQDGTAQGKLKIIKRVGFWLMDTLGLKYGKDADSLTSILSARWGDNFGEATPMFTGVTRERFEDSSNRVGQIYFRVDTPCPATVLSIMPQGTTEDDS